MSAPRSVTVLLNAAAGSAKRESAIDAQIRSLADAAGVRVDIVTIAPGRDLVAAARAASERSSIVVAGGGDGTVNGVVAGILDSPAALGILPLGTLNHFAKDLHLPLDLAAAVGVIAAGPIWRVDVAQVNERVFVNNSSIGIYPGIVEAREELRREGHSKWPAMVIAMVRVLTRYTGVTIRVEVEGRSRTWRTPFVFAGNNEYTIDGLQLGARARLDEGKLYLYVAPRTRTRDLPMLLAKALLGRAARSRAFEIVSATELQIDRWRGRHMRVAIDGEVTTMSTPLVYRIRPKGLRVVVPGT
jgi:diacylglycerol kinase family enzyme